MNPNTDITIDSATDDPEFYDLPDNNEYPADDEEAPDGELDDEDETELDDDELPNPSEEGGELSGGDPAIQKGPQVEDLPDSENEERSGPRM